jgi:hypothetical protein
LILIFHWLQISTKIFHANFKDVTIDANGVLSANDTNVSFSEISGKPTNISGYGITDAYTKTQVDTMVGNIASALDTINGQVI